MKSSQLGGKDYQSIYGLIGECRELGDDPAIWLQHFYAGLGRFIGADVVFGGEMGGVPAGPMYTIGTTEWGWEAGFNRAGWLKSLEMFDRDSLVFPVLRSLANYLKDHPSATLPRRQLLDDRAWYTSDEYNVIHAAMGTDAMMHSFLPVPGTRDDFSGVITNREVGRKNFDERERRFVAHLHAELMPHVGQALARFDEPQPSDLAPRVRQVLRCVLEGDSDKQVAARLSLSPHTVNQYLKTIHRHFGVCSRAELLARWIRRGWSAGCKWAEPTK